MKLSAKFRRNTDHFQQHHGEQNAVVDPLLLCYYNIGTSDGVLVCGMRLVTAIVCDCLLPSAVDLPCAGVNRDSAEVLYFFFTNEASSN